MDVRRIEPGAGQESVWDYPRPPIVEAVPERVTVVVLDASGEAHTLVDTVRAVRVLETSQAPAYYLPPEDVDGSLLRPNDRHTHCEWKGRASYVDIVVGERVIEAAGWCYAEPRGGYEAIADHLAFYPQLVDRCTVGDDVVSPNDGDFYGGWITPRVVGPFKGGAGTWGW